MPPASSQSKLHDVAVDVADNPNHKLARQYVELLTTGGGQRAPCDENSHFEMRLPSWFDPVRFERAQQAYRWYAFSAIMGTMVGMLSVLAVPSIRRVLEHTRYSATGQLSYRRYLSTAQHTTVWATEPLEPGSRSWQSLELVRKRHLLSSRSAERAQVGFISQRDLALVQFALIGYVLNNSAPLGFAANQQDRDAFAHFWRVIGHMLGMHDEYNLFVGDREQDRLRLQYVEAYIIRPALGEPDDEFRGIADALCEGLGALQPLLTPVSFLYVVRWVNGCPGYSGYWSGGADSQVLAMGWWDRAMLWAQMVVHTVLVRWAVTRFALSVWIIGCFMLATYAPVLAVWRFGWRRNYVRIMQGIK